MGSLINHRSQDCIHPATKGTSSQSKASANRKPFMSVMPLEDLNSRAVSSLSYAVADPQQTLKYPCPCSQYLRILAPTTIPLVVLGTGLLKYGGMFGSRFGAVHKSEDTTIALHCGRCYLRAPAHPGKLKLRSDGHTLRRPRSVREETKSASSFGGSLRHNLLPIPGGWAQWHLHAS